MLQITVHNSFQWLGEDKTEMSAVHQETMFIKVCFISSLGSVLLILFFVG